MKRKYFTLALAGLVSFALVGTSCGDDDDSPSPTPIVKPDPEPDPDPDPNPNPGDEDNIQNHVIVVQSQKMLSHEWDTQFWFGSDTEFKGGDTWEISFRYKADAPTDAKIPTQIHKGAGNYVFYQAIGEFAFTTEWQTFSTSGKFTDDMFDGTEGELVDKSGNFVRDAATCIAFNLNQHNPANKYYFDDFSFKLNGEEVIVNGNLEDKTAGFANFWIKEAPAGETDKDKIDANQPVQITKDNLCEDPGNTVAELTDEEKNLAYDTPKTITWKGKWAAPSIEVEADWTALTVVFEGGKPENVQFNVISDFKVGENDWDYKCKYPQVDESGETTMDLAAILAEMQGEEGDESTKITKVTIQYTEDVAAPAEGEEANYPTAKVKTIIATLKDGSKIRAQKQGIAETVGSHSGKQIHIDPTVERFQRILRYCRLKRQ